MKVFFKFNLYCYTVLVFCKLIHYIFIQFTGDSAVIDFPTTSTVANATANAT